jgi:hypothetical protein
MPTGLEDLSPKDLEAINLGRRLMGNPESRLEALRLARKLDPNLKTPELDIHDSIAASEDRARKREEKIEGDLMAERVARRQGERNKQITDAGLEVAAVEAIIVEEKCSYETAMKLALAEQRSAEPTAGDVRSGNVQGTPIEIRGDADFRKAGSFGVGALRKLSSKLAGEMIDGFRGRRTNTR